MTHKLLALSAALILAGCGATDTAHSDDTHMADAHSDMDHGSMDHTDHDMAKPDTAETMSGPGDTGETTGVIRSIGETGDFLTLSHEAIDGVGMGAMTMGFATLSDVDLSEYQVGDRVAFSVKRGRDGSYRITAICKTEGSDRSCLAG